MSYQEIQQSTIFENVAKLVKCLTGFEVIYIPNSFKEVNQT